VSYGVIEEVIEEVMKFNLGHVGDEALCGRWISVGVGTGLEYARGMFDEGGGDTMDEEERLKSGIIGDWEGRVNLVFHSRVL
jgi:hypothetical protein